MTAARDGSPGLEGIVAAVTGGASGIGRAVAESFVARGARVAVLDLTAANRPSGALGVTCDVTDDESVRAAMTTVASELGGLDVLVNNAGVGASGTVADNDDEQWHRVFDVNVVGIARVSRAALPLLRTSGHPAIVNMCSVVATVGLPQRALYSASKGAVLSLTLAMAADHVHEGIRVNCVLPGTVDTPWVRRLLDATDDPDREYAALKARQSRRAPWRSRRGVSAARVPPPASST